MLLNPSIYILINDYIISDNTIYNITTLMSIINAFVTGKFYKDISKYFFKTDKNYKFKIFKKFNFYLLSILLKYI